MIKEISVPKLKKPVFIAAWPGMGEVAYRSVVFLREAMGFKVFAKLEAGDFFKPAAIFVERGILGLPSLPAGFFSYLKRKNQPDIILFLGEAQPPLEYAEALSETIINFVKKYGASSMLTFAAKPEPIDHKADPGVWAASTNVTILKDLEPFGIKALKEGQISGLNGIILGVAKRKGIKGTCLLGEIPFYTVQIENPRASMNILKALSNYLNLGLNLSPLQERSKFIEEEIDKLVGYIKGEENAAPVPAIPTPLSEDDVDRIKKDLAAYSKLPQSVRERIEGFFKEAQKDMTKANALKRELDHWHVYHEYEDRFLDLFKKQSKEKGSH